MTLRQDDGSSVPRWKQAVGQPAPHIPTDTAGGVHRRTTATWTFPGVQVHPQATILLTDTILLQPIRIDGIFFDEVLPHHDSSDRDRDRDCMQQAAAPVRHIAISPSRSQLRATNPDKPNIFNLTTPSESPATIIYNPGTPPPPNSPYFGPSQADYIVIFEGTLETWRESEYIRSAIQSLNDSERGKSIAIVHSALELQDRCAFSAEVVQEVGMAGHFATGSCDYTAWDDSDGWWGFVEELGGVGLS